MGGVKVTAILGYFDLCDSSAIRKGFRPTRVFAAAQLDILDWMKREGKMDLGET